MRFYVPHSNFVSLIIIILFYFFYFTKNNKNILRKKIYIENCFASNLGTDDRKETSNGFAHCATFLNFFEFGFEHPT